jgi:hypothetical protein
MKSQSTVLAYYKSQIPIRVPEILIPTLNTDRDIMK